MGNLHSLLASKPSQDVLEAAEAGDVACLKEKIACEPRLVDSVTLLKRRGVLHLAAKHGHAAVITTVLEPFIAAVREEYYAQLTPAEAQKVPEECEQQLQPQEQQQAQLPSQQQQQQTEQQQQQQQQQTEAQFSESSRTGSMGTTPQPAQRRPQQHSEPHLASFKRLRSAVNARDLYRRTPLIIAAKKGHLHCVQLLLDSAANMFAVDREGNTSLHYAALHCHSDVAEHLLRKADERGLATRFVNKRNLSGFTPLHYAVWGCCEVLVSSLLRFGADMTLTNDRVFDAWVTVPVGSSPLHLAVVRNSVPISLILLQQHMLELVSAPTSSPRPPDPRSLVNLYGMNAAQLAAHRGLRQLSRILMPSTSLVRVLEAFELADGMRVLGPPSLKVIAAAALQALLAQQLATMEAQVQGGGGTGLSACQPPEPLPDHTAPAAARSPTACSAMQAGTPAVLVTLQEIVIPTHVATPTAASPHGKRCTDTPVGASGGGTAGLHACPVPRTHSSGWYEEKCCVCWEADVDVAMRPCTHALCLMCARQLVDSSGTTGTTCPLCRCLIGDFRLLLPPDAHGGSASGGSASGGSASVGGSCTRLLTCTAGL